MLDPELAKKLEERRNVVDSEGNQWETLPEESSADARGEWLLVDPATLVMAGEEMVWAGDEDIDGQVGRDRESVLMPDLIIPSTGRHVFSRCEDDEEGDHVTSSQGHSEVETCTVTDDDTGRAAKSEAPQSELPAAEQQSAASPAARAERLCRSETERLRGERERIQRERAAWAAECSQRWPRLLLRQESEVASEGHSMGAPWELSKADLRVIHADVQRTRSADPAFQAPEMRERLTDLLTGFCQQERVGYMQGLHEVAAVFAFVQSMAPAVGPGGEAFDSAKALACMTAAVHRFSPYFHDGDSFVALHVSLLFFRQLILYHHPDLHNFLEEAGISPLLYATPWFITLFASRTPLSVLLRFWDRYFLRGDPFFLPFLAVATLAAEKSAIFAARREDAHSVVVKVGVKTLERFETVWEAAELLKARTPQSFALRLSRVLAAVMEMRKLPKPAEKPWSERVLDRVAKERRFLMLPGEVMLHLARMASGARPPPTARQQGKQAASHASTEVTASAGSSGDVSREESEASGTDSDVANSVSSAASAAKPWPCKQLQLILLDVRSPEEFEAAHLPQALHFHPACVRRLAASAARGGGGESHIERLAGALKEAVAFSIGGLLAAGAGNSTGGASAAVENVSSSEAVRPDSSLLNEVFAALQASAAARCGEAWLSESSCVHLVLLGGAADAAEVLGTPSRAAAEGSGAGSGGGGGTSSGGAGAVAPLYEALTEHLSLPRVSVALGGATAVHREAVKRGAKLRRSSQAGYPPPPEGADRAAALLGSAAMLGSSAWSRLQAASEALPAVDGVGAQLEGLLRSGAEVARARAQEAARGIAVGVTAVRQQAAESAAVVRQQAAEGFTVVLQKLDKDAMASSTEEERGGIGTAFTGSTVGSLSEVSEPSEGSEASSPRLMRQEPGTAQQELGRCPRTWAAEVWLCQAAGAPLEASEAGGRLPLDQILTTGQVSSPVSAVLGLTSDGVLLIAASQSASSAVPGVEEDNYHVIPEIVGSFCAKSLLRIGTSPTTANLLSFYFAGSTSQPATLSRPALLARFESTELARSCARAVASVAAAARRQKSSQPVEAAAEHTGGASDLSSATSAAAQRKLEATEAPSDLRCPYSPAAVACSAESGTSTPSMASVPAPATTDDFLLELEALSAGLGEALPSTLARAAPSAMSANLDTAAAGTEAEKKDAKAKSSELDAEAFLRELDELAGFT